MKALMSLAASLSLALGGMGLMGCATDDSTLPKTDRSGFAGGNGEFGETPEKAGRYYTPTPTTQPSASDANQSSR